MAAEQIQTRGKKSIEPIGSSEVDELNLCIQNNWFFWMIPHFIPSCAGTIDYIVVLKK